VSDSGTPTKWSYARIPRAQPIATYFNCDGKHEIYIMCERQEEEYVDAGSKRERSSRTDLSTAT